MISTTESVDLRWGRFAVRMGLGLAWLILATVATGFLQHETMVLRIGAAFAIAAPAFIWMAALGSQAEIDELEAKIAITAQSQGCWWAVSFGAGFYALMTLMGEQMNGSTLAVLPAGAFFFGEVMAQVSRWGLSRPAERSEP